jgi:hypothetical protein
MTKPLKGELNGADDSAALPGQLGLERGIFRRQLADGLPEPRNHALG